MQDPTAFQVQPMKPHFPEQEQLKCPRCDSTNTKFCYYNNYNLSQPRHFCKNCRRYWTKGGALRNIPVGGGTRKSNKRCSSSSSTKRPSSSISSSSVLASAQANNTTNTIIPESDPTRICTNPVDQDQRVLNIGGSSFSSLLASSGHFGTLLEGLNSNGSGIKMLQMGEFGGGNVGGSDPIMNSDSGRNPGLDMQNGDSSYWNGGGHGWSDLAIYTPGSSFQ